MSGMLFIQWTSDSELGIPIIDEQHRGIVTTINTLHFFSAQGQGVEVLMPTFKIMEQYSILHFKLEEAMMQQAGFPNFAKHRQTHRELIEKTIAVRTRSTLENNPTLALSFLKEWWVGHIKGEDREHVHWLK